MRCAGFDGSLRNLDGKKKVPCYWRHGLFGPPLVTVGSSNFLDSHYNCITISSCFSCLNSKIFGEGSIVHVLACESCVDEVVVLSGIPRCELPINVLTGDFGCSLPLHTRVLPALASLTDIQSHLRVFKGSILDTDVLAEVFCFFKIITVHSFSSRQKSLAVLITLFCAFFFRRHLSFLPVIIVVGQAARGCDGIYHLAGAVLHSRKPALTKITMDVNVTGTKNVMDVAAASGCACFALLLCGAFHSAWSLLFYMLALFLAPDVVWCTHPPRASWAAVWTEITSPMTNRRTVKRWTSPFTSFQLPLLSFHFIFVFTFVKSKMLARSFCLFF